VQVIHRGIVQKEYHLPLAGVVATTPSPSRRRRVRANITTANEERSVTSVSSTSVALNAEQATTTNVNGGCIICTNDFLISERVVCSGCNNFICVQCFGNMERVSMGRAVNCPFCRRRLYPETISLDDVLA
jgi:hypothetical protein